MGRMPSAPQSVNCHQGRPLSATCLCPTPRCWHARPLKPGQKKDKWNQKPKMHFHFIPLFTRFLFPPIIRMQGVRDIHSPSDIHICTGMWMSWWHSKTKKHASKVEPKFYHGYKLAGWVARLSQLTVFLPSPSFSGHEAMLLFSSSFEDVALMEFMYLVFINMTGADYCWQMVVRHLSSTTLCT